MINKISERLFLIDTNMSGRQGYTSVFLARGQRAALFDSGVSVTAKTILAGVNEAGVSLDQLDFIFLTHAHYDHAGGAHELLRLLRKAGKDRIKIACAEKPAVYLSRPDICEKLMRSGRVTEGEMAGEMAPIGRDDFLVLAGGEEVDLGGVQVRALDAPGHANGHLVFHLPELDFIFVGDACGLLGFSGAGKPVIAPTAFAPEFRHDVYADTVRMIAGMGASRLGFAHYGILADPGPVLMEAAERTGWLKDLSSRARAGEVSRESALAKLDAAFGEALAPLYPDAARLALVFKSLLSGSLHDLERKEKPPYN